jgi:tyrosine-specific transport protein
MNDEEKIVQHKGIFRKQVPLFEGVSLIVSGTIGAGVLGIPYAVAKVGLGLGLLYILLLGLLMMGMNLLVGEIAIRTRGEFQIVGFANKYLGSWGKWIMTVLAYIMLFGILVIYIIGISETLSALFGGSMLFWGIAFWLLGSLLISLGMRTLKTVELFLTLAILAVIALIVLMSSPHVEFVNFQYNNLAQILLPYGVILFAFSGATAIPEAHSILSKNNNTFKKAIIISGIISIVAYALFTTIVVGVTGLETTEIATIGLGGKVGNHIFLLGNIFAILAMGTSFLLSGIALRDSLRWDFKISYNISTVITCVIPLVLFLAGLRSFIATIDIVGGVFMSLQMLFIVLIYWRAKQKGDLPVGKYKLHHTWFLVVLLILSLSIGAIYSFINIF